MFLLAVVVVNLARFSVNARHGKIIKPNTAMKNAFVPADDSCVCLPQLLAGSEAATCGFSLL